MAGRFLNLCDPQRHPTTPDPDSNTFLPVDDAAWNSGVRPPLGFNLSGCVLITPLRHPRRQTQ